MQKILFSLAALLLSVFLLHAQNDAKPLKVKFGKLSEEELKMTKYDKDPDAPAVILFDKGYCSLGKSEKYTRHTRIKIFKKTAYEYANIAFEFPKSTFVNNIKAVTYNIENGKVIETKLAKESIFEEKITKNWNIKKITMPDVREGSIIELQYDIDGGVISNWIFQHEIPTMWSEYGLHIPEFWEFSKIGQGSTPYLVDSQNKTTESVPWKVTTIIQASGSIPTSLTTSTSSSQANVFTYGVYENLWIQKDVPAFKPEKLITSSADYVTKLSFYLKTISPPAGYGAPKRIIQTWQEAAKELIDDSDFFGFLDKKNAMKDELATVVNNGMKPREKVQAIFDYVGKNFENNNNRSLFLSGTIKELKEKRKITASEMNLLALNMLKTSGIEVHPVLISTRKHGKINTDLPVMNRFDRVIGHVLFEKDTFFIDVASYPHPIDLLPFEDLNGGGVRVLGKRQLRYCYSFKQNSNT
jgi:hypothetical protein